MEAQRYSDTEWKLRTAALLRDARRKNDMDAVSAIIEWLSGNGALYVVIVGQRGMNDLQDHEVGGVFTTDKAASDYCWESFLGYVCWCHANKRPDTIEQTVNTLKACEEPLIKDIVRAYTSDVAWGWSYWTEDYWGEMDNEGAWWEILNL